jgi:hypothetical protein
MNSKQPQDSQSSPALRLRKLANDKALLRLDRSLRQFNFFEAMGAVRQELRHSDFLAFLLNPYGNHGLKGRFSKILLDQIAKSRIGKAGPTNFANKSKTLATAEVRREWRNMDILVRFTSIKLALIIENKIDSSERDGQLDKYWQTVLDEFPGWTVRGIYLTPDGEKPGNPNYWAIGYDLISRSIETLFNQFSRGMTGDFRTAMKHYSNMIQQKITRQLENQCWKLYTKHQYAFDLIRDYVDRSDPIGAGLKLLIENSPMLEFDNARPGYVQFYLRGWENTTFLKSKQSLKDLIFFEFQYGKAQHAKGSLVLLLVIFNDNNGKEPAQLFNQAKQSCPPFRQPRSLSRFPVIFSQQLMSKEEMISLTPALREKKIAGQWREFVNRTLPSLRKAIRKQFTA